MRKLRWKLANWLLGDSLRKNLAWAKASGEKRLSLPNQSVEKYRKTIECMLECINEIQGRA